MLNVSLIFVRRFAIIGTIALLSAITLSSCNTVSGIGKDIGAVGDGISSVAGGNKSTAQNTQSKDYVAPNTGTKKYYNYKTKQYEYKAN